MKTIKNVLFALFITTILTSCSNDEQDYSVQRFDRNITFKVIGEYSGTLTVAYGNPTSENGVTPGEILTAFPWGKNLDYNRNIKLTAAYVSGENGQPNEIIQIQVFSNGELVETEIGIADEQGRMFAGTSTIYFK